MTATVTGLKAIDKRFANLTGSKQREFIRKGARAAGSIQMKATKQLIPDRKSRDDKGKLIGLKRSMQQIPSSKWKNAGELRRKGIIGTRVGFKRKGGAHAHLVEFGHEIVTTKASGHRRTGRKTKPQPFMRPAMDANKSRMKRAFQKKIIEGIRKNTQ